MGEAVVEQVKGSLPVVPDGKDKGPPAGAETASPPDKGSGDTAGTEFAEFKDPQDAARFKRVYGHVKRNERLIGVMAGDNKVLFDANQKLTERLSALEKHIAEKGTADSISILQAERQAAVEAGDIGRVAALSDQIAEIRVKTEIAKLPSKAPAVVSPPPRGEQDFLGPELRGAFQTWAAQKEQNGSFTRPWAQPDHPKFKRAVEMTATVLNDPEYRDDGDISKVLREVDRLMGYSKPATATVLSGKEAGGTPVKVVKLTADQIAVAKKMGVKVENYSAMLEKYKRV